MIVDVIIPAFNEEKSIAHVLKDIPKDLVRHVIVANNNSTDNTSEVARSQGAIVVFEQKAGYGAACLKAMNYIADLKIKPDVLVFLDGDYSDYPEQMHDLIEELMTNNRDLVIGSRNLGNLEKGAMKAQQIFGNWLATSLIKMIYRYTFTDLGPFRAVRYDSLLKIDMKDRDYGWTVEMQVKAAKLKMNCSEIPVNYRNRIGKSKVSGTLKGTILAGHKILWTIFKLL